MIERLQNLEQNILQLRRFRESNTLQDVKDDITKEWALLYGLIETIQIIIDVSCHLVAHHNFGKADTYADCFHILGSVDILDDEMVSILKSMAGLRNLLIHEYIVIDVDQL